MNKLDKLYKLCEDENIQIEWVNFNPCILGLYISDKDIPPTIALNKSIFNDRLKTMEILAEEVGHHFTTNGNFANRLLHYSDRVRLSKEEQKAARWACNFLIGDVELFDCVKKCTSEEELIEMLDVSFGILYDKLKFCSVENRELLYNICNECVDSFLYAIKNDVYYKRRGREIRPRLLSTFTLQNIFQ